MDTRVSFSAPWCLSLKIVSLCAVLVLLGVSAALWLSRDGSPSTMAFALLALLPLVGIAVAALFIVRSYSIGSNDLQIHRPLWHNSFALEELQSVEVDSQAMARSIRLFGNGGMLSITGLHRNKKLGNYWSYANDPARAVVLRFSAKKIVIAPENPEEFEAVLEQAMTKLPLRGEQQMIH